MDWAERELDSSPSVLNRHEVSPLLPAGEFGGQFGEKVAGSTAAGLRERGGIVGEGGRGRRPVVRGRAAVPQLAAVEGAAAGGASREAQSVGCGGVGDAVDRRHRVPLGAGRHGDAAEAEGRRTRGNRTDPTQFQLQEHRRLKVIPLQTDPEPWQLIFSLLFT